MKTWTYREASTEAVKRGIDPFFESRLDDMIWHVTRNSCGNSPVKDLFVSKGWPLRGSVRFTRVDNGKRYKAYATKKKFRAVEV